MFYVCLSKVVSERVGGSGGEVFCLMTLSVANIMYRRWWMSEI